MQDESGLAASRRSIWHTEPDDISAEPARSRSYIARMAETYRAEIFFEPVVPANAVEACRADVQRRLPGAVTALHEEDELPGRHSV